VNDGGKIRRWSKTDDCFYRGVYRDVAAAFSRIQRSTQMSYFVVTVYSRCKNRQREEDATTRPWIPI